ncbi:MAG TPA: ABC-2 family transporter protein, partial [Acidimicrobiales bacterium]|nr:ABC-2 family transporter protein [Acidimicrobiales bacterium]
LLMGAYPVDVFAGAVKVLLFSVVPAAFVATVPARLIDDFDLALAGQLVGVAAIFALAAAATFTLGLRRYTSGSVWTRA